MNSTDSDRLLAVNGEDANDYEDGSDQQQSSLSSSHCHSLISADDCRRRARRSLQIAAVLSAAFIIVEFAGGLWANSLAIVTDAGHMLSDLLSFVISLLALRLSRSAPTKRLSFGFDRVEVLAALASVAIIWILTAVLVYLAVLRVVHHEFEIETVTMMVTAAIGVIFNIIMVAILHHGHAPDEHHDNNNDDRTRQHTVNYNIRAALIHVIGDLVQSIGVLVAATIIHFTEFKLADPICTFLFSIIVLITTAGVLRDVVMVLLEASPKSIDYDAIKLYLHGIDGVVAVHSLHIWSLNVDKTAMTAHLAIGELTPPINSLIMVKEISAWIRFTYDIQLVTIQLEPYDELMTSCEHCIGPCT